MNNPIEEVMNLLIQKAKQATHGHNALTGIAGKFAGCGCRWCFLCDCAPQDCKCDENETPVLLTE